MVVQDVYPIDFYLWNKGAVIIRATILDKVFTRRCDQQSRLLSKKVGGLIKTKNKKSLLLGRVWQDMRVMCGVVRDY